MFKRLFSLATVFVATQAFALNLQLRPISEASTVKSVKALPSYTVVTLSNGAKYAVYNVEQKEKSWSKWVTGSNTKRVPNELKPDLKKWEDQQQAVKVLKPVNMDQFKQLLAEFKIQEGARPTLFLKDVTHNQFVPARVISRAKPAVKKKKAPKPAQKNLNVPLRQRKFQNN